MSVNKQLELLYTQRLKYGIMLFGVGLFIFVISYLLPYTQMPMIMWIKR